MKRALLSVTDKTGLVDFARGLTELGVELISTGGTARVLAEAGLDVVALSDYTDWPEMLDGRVKTLHPKVHAGILARRDLESHRDQMSAHGLGYIDLVVVNLYDFEGALARQASFEDTVEEIDIGGPTLLRAAAKNHAHTLPVVSPEDYPAVLEALKAGDLPQGMRQEFALKVFSHTARYDALVAGYFAGQQEAEGAPPIWVEAYERDQALRYGENPHQSAAFYRPLGAPRSGLCAAAQLNGKELSYNNILDTEAAFGLAVDLMAAVDKPSCVYIKHNNPCGVASHASLAEAVKAARAVDPISAFGAVVALNRPVDLAAAEVLAETFLEVIIAPDYTPEAQERLCRKKNLRLLSLGEPEAWALSSVPGRRLRAVRGGALMQDQDQSTALLDELAGARVVTKRAPTDEERAGLMFSWIAAKHVRSNAIVFGAADRLLAVGAGQMSRVDSVKLCGLKAQTSLEGSVVASDAFFPFRDGVDVLAEAGATAIVQPGGSVRDQEVIEAADEHNIAMLFTGVRHFKH